MYANDQLALEITSSKLRATHKVILLTLYKFDWCLALNKIANESKISMAAVANGVQELLRCGVLVRTVEGRNGIGPSHYTLCRERLVEIGYNETRKETEAISN